jgi:SPP1 gp7 family putative phage head morphogenesis protein
VRLSSRFPFVRFDDDRGPNKSALDTTRRRHINELLRSESKAQKRILKAWKGAEKRILRDLARLLKSMEAAESLGIPLSPSFIYREARLQEFLTTVRQETAALGDVAVDATAAAQEAMVNAGLQHALQRLEAYLPDQSFIRLPKEAVNHLVGNLADGSPLSELLGTLPSAAVGQVEQVLIDGLATARNPREIARAIRKVALDTPRDRAVLISRTEINRAYRSSLIESYKANDHVCSGWVWRSARDRRTCPVCLTMDGQRFKWDDPFGSHPACRCTPDPVLKYLDDPDSESDTGEAWLRKQPEDRQLQALGPTRLRIWRGGLPMKDLVQVVPNDKWGPGRKMMPLKALAERSSAVEKLKSQINIPDAKLTRYLLDRNHVQGGPKAKFLYEMGFDQKEPDILRKAITDLAIRSTPEKGDQTPYGQKWSVVGQVVGPTDSREMTAVFIDKGGTIDLVTLVPSKRRKE